MLFFDFHLFLRGCFGLLGFKHAANCLIPSYIRRGTGGHRDSRRWEIRELIYTYVTLSPPECLCVKIGCDKSHFNISLKVRDKGTRLWPQTTTFEKREKAGMGSKPRACLSSQGTILISCLLLFMAVSHPSSLMAQSVFSDTRSPGLRLLQSGFSRQLRGPSTKVLS